MFVFWCGVVWCCFLCVGVCLVFVMLYWFLLVLLYVVGLVIWLVGDENVRWYNILIWFVRVLIVWVYVLCVYSGKLNCIYSLLFCGWLCIVNLCWYFMIMFDVGFYMMCNCGLIVIVCLWKLFVLIFMLFCVLFVNCFRNVFCMLICMCWLSE